MNKQRSACTLLLLFAALSGIVVQYTSGLTNQGECSKIKGPLANCACKINGSNPEVLVNIGALDRNISLHGPRYVKYVTVANKSFQQTMVLLELTIVAG